MRCQTRTDAPLALCAPADARHLPGVVPHAIRRRPAIADGGVGPVSAGGGAVRGGADCAVVAVGGEAVALVGGAVVGGIGAAGVRASS